MKYSRAPAQCMLKAVCSAAAAAEHAGLCSMHMGARLLWAILLAGWISTQMWWRGLLAGIVSVTKGLLLHLRNIMGLNPQIWGCICHQRLA